MKVLLVMRDSSRVTLSTSNRGAAAIIASVYGNPFVEQVAITELTDDGSVYWNCVWRVSEDYRTFQWFYKYDTLKSFLLNGEDCEWLRNTVPEDDGRKTVAIEQGINAMWRAQARAWNFE